MGNKVIDGKVIKATLGKQIKFFRFRKNYSQADLAEKADISVIHLSSIERGVKFPQPDMMARIANALEINVHELFVDDSVNGVSSKTLAHFSEDIRMKLDLTLQDVLKQYTQ